VKEVRPKAIQENFQVKKKLQGVLGENEGLLLPTLMTLKLRYLNSKGNSILISFLSGCIQLNESLNTKRYQMIRKLDLLLLDYASMLYYGGLTCV